MFKVMFKGWHDACLVIVRLEESYGAIQVMQVAFDRQLAFADVTIDRTFKWKAKRVQLDRKAFVADTISQAANAASTGDWASFYLCIRKLKPANRRSFPMLKGKDGAFLPSPQAFADRWVEFVQKNLLAGLKALLLCNALLRQRGA